MHVETEAIHVYIFPFHYIFEDILYYWDKSRFPISIKSLSAGQIHPPFTGLPLYSHIWGQISFLHKSHSLQKGSLDGEKLTTNTRRNNDQCSTTTLKSSK